MKCEHRNGYLPVLSCFPLKILDMAYVCKEEGKTNIAESFELQTKDLYFISCIYLSVFFFPFCIGRKET